MIMMIIMIIMICVRVSAPCQSFFERDHHDFQDHCVMIAIFIIIAAVITVLLALFSASHYHL